MSGICERCNERNSHIISIVSLPELASVSHLGYRLVCAPCYDDLLDEANEVRERDEDRRAEPRARVAIKARVEGHTAKFEAFADEMTIEEVSPSGLRLRTGRDLDRGAVLTVTAPAHGLEATALVEVVWQEAGERYVGLKLVEPNEAWESLWRKHAPELGEGEKGR